MNAARRLLALACTAVAVSFASPIAAAPTPTVPPLTAKAQWPFQATAMGSFDEPWAMSFLPNGTLLVSERKGALKRYDVATRRSVEIGGAPPVAYAGQGGFGDVLPHPQFARNGWVYLSYAEAGEGDTRGA
ncbi:PQQ-dependent sugar dehydrogenase, partial [Xanthomonas sp. Kuri4-2]